LQDFYTKKWHSANVTDRGFAVNRQIMIHWEEDIDDALVFLRRNRCKCQALDTYQAISCFVVSDMTYRRIYKFVVFIALAGLTDLLDSCINSNIKNTTTIESFDIDLTEELEKYDVAVPFFDIYRFKSQLDSLLSIVEYKNFQFQLNIDTINEKTNPAVLWNFRDKFGLFKIIDSKNTSQLVLYHLFDPKTRKVLRIYLIEASYNDSITFDNVYQTFILEKDRKKLFIIEDDENEYYINYRLTWLNDYVIVLENKIYWLNVSQQYSMKNFNAIIDYFKDNLNVKNYIDTIKCIHD
jgi:hypothetical protein